MLNWWLGVLNRRIFGCSFGAKALTERTSSGTREQRHYARFVIYNLVIVLSFQQFLKITFFLFLLIAVSAAPAILSQRTKLERAKVSLVTVCVCLILEMSFIERD